MKFKFIGKQEMDTPLVGRTRPGDVVEYNDNDPRCGRLLRSSFFRLIEKEKPKIEKKIVKKELEDLEE